MDEIEIEFTLAERDLIIDHTFGYTDLTSKLQFAEVKGDQIKVKYSIKALEDLIAYIAAEAYYPVREELGKKLNILMGKLSQIRKRNMDR